MFPESIRPNGVTSSEISHVGTTLMTSDNLIEGSFDRVTYRIGVFGIGGAGARMAHQLGIDQPGMVDRTIVIDSGLRRYAGFDEFQNLQADRKIWIDACEGDASTTFYQWQREIRARSKAASSEIAESIAGLDVVLLIASMGEFEGNEMSPIIANELRARNILTIGLPIMPLNEEQPFHTWRARIGVHELGKCVHSLLPISKQAIAGAHYDTPGKLRNISQDVDQVVYQVVEMICTTLYHSEQAYSESENIQAALSLGGYCAFGCGSGSGLNKVVIALDKAVEHPLLGQRYLQQASGIVLLAASNFDRFGDAEKHRILNLIRPRLSPTANVQFHTNLYLGDSDRLDVWILAGGISDPRLILGKSPLMYTQYQKFRREVHNGRLIASEFGYLSI